MDIHSRVREVAAELVSAGIWPTVQEIRARLGSGSNTTINNTLRQWRQTFLSQMATTARHPDWSPALAQAFNQLWQQACTEADNNLASQREEAKAEVERLITELAAASREQQNLAANLHAQTQQQQTLQAALAAENASNTALKSELATLAATLAKTRTELDIAQAQALHSKQQADERAIAQDTRHENELQQRQTEADRREALAYERVEGVRHQLYQQLEDERASMRQREQQWQQSLQQLTTQADTQRETSQRQLAAQAQDNGRLAAERDTLQAQLSTSMANLASWQQRHAEQGTALAEHQDMLRQAQQAQTLFHEHRLPHLLLWLQARQHQLADMPADALASEIRQLLAS